MRKETLKQALEILKAAYVPADLDKQREMAITAFEAELAKPDFWEGYVSEPVKAATTETNGGRTGWPPGLLQDDCKGLSKWLSNKPDAKRRVREALDKMAENARELGLDYEPLAGTQVSKVWWDGEKLMAKPIPLEDFYEPAQQEPVAWLVECGGDSALVRHTENFPGIFAGNEFNKRPLVFGDKSPPAQRKPLTDEQISNLWCEVSNTDFVTADTHEFARAIEAAYGIKENT